MLGFFTLAAIFVTSQAIVCLPEYCNHVTQPVLDCKGGIIQNGGFCGCTDICAQVEGEPCTSSIFLGVPDTHVCDDGLVCIPRMLEGHSEGSFCVKESDVLVDHNLMSKREVPRCSTTCQRKSLQCTISMVVYEGQWFAQCDEFGNFLPQQCDNTNHCFCVDTLTGEVQEDTKVLGAAQC